MAAVARIQPGLVGHQVSPENANEEPYYNDHSERRNDNGMFRSVLRLEELQKKAELEELEGKQATGLQGRLLTTVGKREDATESVRGLLCRGCMVGTSVCRRSV